MAKQPGEKGVFIPKPQYKELYSSLDQALFDAKNIELEEIDRAAAKTLALTLQAEIALLGSSAGEFVYPD